MSFVQEYKTDLIGTIDAIDLAKVDQIIGSSRGRATKDVTSSPAAMAAAHRARRTLSATS